jgi:pyruvate formate lyase activating enzyme
MENVEVKIPLVTEIQRFCLQDGPGIRTTLFVKGCPLHCPWCHNPETQSAKKELYHYANLCVQCGACVDICPEKACTLVSGAGGVSRIEINRDICTACGQCVDACLYGARELVGQQLTMDQILKELLSDDLFYQRSGGGVTISGGDPLLFPEFSLQLSKMLREKGIHVAMETSCFPDFRVIRPLIGNIDLFLVDIKTLDDKKHLEAIGRPLEPILDNISRLIDADANVRIHLPIIPGFNDAIEDYNAYVEFLAPYAEQLTGVDVLPFHSYGLSKYEYLGRGKSYQYKDVEDKSPKHASILAQALAKAGIVRVSVGGLVGMGSDKGKMPEKGRL